MSYRPRDDFTIGLMMGAIYTGAAALALAGFLGTYAYVHHLDTQSKINRYEQKIEALEEKVEEYDRKHHCP